MTEWKAVGTETLLKDGTMTEVRVGDMRILLARVQGNYYAVQALCPHLGGNLARGRLNEFVVRCPQHGSQFDLRDGHVVAWIAKIPGIARKLAVATKKPQDLRNYRTRVQDGQVWVEIE